MLFFVEVLLDSRNKLKMWIFLSENCMIMSYFKRVEKKLLDALTQLYDWCVANNSSICVQDEKASQVWKGKSLPMRVSMKVIGHALFVSQFRRRLVAEVHYGKQVRGGKKNYWLWVVKQETINDILWKKKLLDIPSFSN